MRFALPALKKSLRRDGLNLLSEPIHVDIHHCVVRFVSRTAKRVLHEDDPKAPVNRAQHRAQNANVRAAGFAPDQRRLGCGRQARLCVSAGRRAAHSYHAGSVRARLFAMMFKWLPDVSVGWRDVWLGASLTAVFFEIGKAGIGFTLASREWNQPTGLPLRSSSS